MRYDLMAVVGIPAVMWLCFLGCGLALERALGIRLANALLLPLGLCVTLVLVFPGYVLGAGDPLAIALLVVVTVAGLVFARDGLRHRLNPGWPGVAGAGIYVLYMLPVIATGHWTWTGYDFVNDSSFEMLLASHSQGFGTALGNIPETSAREFLASYLSNGYPLGTQTLLGTFSGLSATPVDVIYQGYISALAALAAMALATVPRGLLKASWAALAGFLAVAANLTYQYALQGGIKEIGLLATVCAAVALALEAISLTRPYIGAVLVAVPGAACLTVYNAVAAPFLGALVVFIALGLILVRRPAPAQLREKPSRYLGPLAVGLCLTALLATPSLLTFKTFFNVARAGQAASGVGATQLGQLLRPLPLSQLSGVWLAGEYRAPVVAQPAATLTAIATGVILLLTLCGLVVAVLRRQPGPVLLLGTMGLVMLIVYPRVSPYARGKLLAIVGPAAVLVAIVALGVVRGRGAPAAAVIAAALGVAIIASDLLAYGYARVAPTGRMEAIEQTAAHFRGQGLVLWNEFEEYAKYFGRAARISVPFEALTPQQVQLRSPTYFYGHYFDLDQEVLSFVEAYPIIVTRRSPAASRPPANYELVYQNHYYLGWRRTSQPQVLRHLPLQSRYSSSATITCAALHALVTNAPTGSELVIARAPEVSVFEPLYARDRSYGWGLVPAQPGAIIANTPGHASGTIDLAGGGDYSVWVQGDFPRPVKVQLDGRSVGSVSGSNTPGQWLKVASLHLSPGGHRVRLEKEAGRSHLGPGEWSPGIIGAVALERKEPETLETLPTADWRTLCGSSADWVELVRR